MLITSLETMETIVENNKSLKWQGWDVVHHKPSTKAWTSKDGAYLNNQWVTAKIYELSSDGWHMPKQLVSEDAK
jgi:hypothetical protein